MLRTSRIVKTTSLWALFTIIMALASAQASAQCCDLIIDVASDVDCCITLDGSEWSDLGRPGGTYCPGVGGILRVPCPATLAWVSVQTAWGSITIPFGTSNKYVRISENCCVYISLDQNWPAAPCNYLRITKAPCWF